MTLKRRSVSGSSLGRHKSHADFEAKELGAIRSQRDVLAKTASLEKKLHKVKRQAQKKYFRLFFMRKSQDVVGKERKKPDDGLKTLQKPEAYAVPIIPDPPRLEHDHQIDNFYIAWEGQMRSKLAGDAAVFDTETKEAAYVICRLAGIHAKHLGPSLARNPNMSVENIFKILRRYCIQVSFPENQDWKLDIYHASDQGHVHARDWLPGLLLTADILGISDDQLIQDIPDLASGYLQDGLGGFKPVDLQDLLRKIHELGWSMDGYELDEEIAISRGR